MNRAFVDYYRCPEYYADFRPLEEGVNGRAPGYFRFGGNLTCYGSPTTVHPSRSVSDNLEDILPQVRIEGSTCFLPFDPTETVDNLRFERYIDPSQITWAKRIIRDAYYNLRPLLPVSLRRHLQRIWLRDWERSSFPNWPVDRTVDRVFERLMALSLKARPGACVPFIWFWPDGKSSCAVITHDVETARGLEFCNSLMDMNDSFEIKTSFQLIPEARYRVSEEVLAALRGRGFEVNVHDLKHDGYLFEDHQQFLISAAKINGHARRFGSTGFRAGALYRNQEWYDAFSFSYDMSVPNVGHLDPQRGGCCTVMPYFVGRILEIPVTTTQDYTLFNVLGTYSLDLWRAQISQIRAQHGLISFIVHPDYLDNDKARGAYSALLHYLASLRSQATLWVTLPGDVDRWWRNRNLMRLVPDGDTWRIEGRGAERARVAFAALKNERVTYSLL